MNKNVKIIILGGGNAGWLAALSIKKYWKNLDITVIEDKKKPPILAGESGNLTFSNFLSYLDISIEEFINETNATPKLGGKLVDWKNLKEEFLHCMQNDFTPWISQWHKFFDDSFNYNNILRLKGQNYLEELYYKIVLGNDVPLSQMLHTGHLIKNNQVPFQCKELPCVPMWHFESRAAANFFKKIAIDRGIKYLDNEYAHSVIDKKGHIQKIIFRDQTDISGDWYIDCTGFNRLLIKEVAEDNFIDYSNFFPAREVVVWWEEPTPKLVTEATAMRYGWSWNINIKHRSGNGYIYDPDHIDVDTAVNEIETRFNKKIVPISNFKFTPGVMKECWKKNVISVGLSSGFLEPLEANGIAMIIEILIAMHDLWDPRSHNQLKKKKFNDRIFAINEDIKDFLCLHYRGHRTDSEYWLDHKNNQRIPMSLLEKLDMFNNFFYSDHSLPHFLGYSSPAWLMVLQGLGLINHEKIKSNTSFGKNNKNTIINSTNNHFAKINENCEDFIDWMKHKYTS